ncbi:MAG: hypothetical protein MUF59_03625 [Candidatus Krumholzibacteria bacterium]|nr:hypothetical protein [Candidatus Krumholzibacteria bacterium]
MGIVSVSVSGSPRRRYIALDPCRACRRFIASALLPLLIAALASAARADFAPGELRDKIGDPDGIWVYDGSGIHNVGNLNLHVTNWGCFGSYPDGNQAVSHLISAQWPANSGVEYLFIAGLWVGARKGGVPVVSTAAFDREFRPAGSEDPLCRIYETTEGAAGGNRLPSPNDDDKDGRADEDWQNGVDDDGDGLVDEDFAAIGKQMFSCWYTDDHPQSALLFPEHTPLHLFVRQESYQWDDRQFWDFVGVEFTIRNYGRDIIEDLYVGFFADGDVGVRGSDNLAGDDNTALWQGIRCARRGETEIPVYVSVAYFFDADGDDGLAPGYFGILFLGHDTDPLGENAPAAVGITSYQNFSGGLPYEDGGDPTNDFERYELMSSGRYDRPGEVPRDYRMLMSTGPFRELLPDSTMKLQVAFVCGYGLDGMLDAAAAAAMVYDGNWFNIDGDPGTGVDGRETPVYGPVAEIDPDTCDTDGGFLSAIRGEVIWVNADCSMERALWEGRALCLSGGGDFSEYQTGVNGKETQVKWLVGTAPPSPHLRVLPGSGKVTLLWDDFSETTPDPSTQEFDFEGYRIWRADNWDRPYGTSAETGPPRELWQLIAERDLVNGVLADIDFTSPCSQGGWEYEPLTGLEGKDAILRLFEESVIYSPMDTVPCPPGLSDGQCDTLEAIARRNMGFQGGMRYYKYVDENVHDGMHYFFSVTAFDHTIVNGQPLGPGKYGDPASNFIYINPLSEAATSSDGEGIYVVPNPATESSMSPWRLEPNMGDPTGIKVEFRNLPACRSTVRIFTLSGDLVEILYHDGSGGSGTLAWDLVTRNGQDITSGVYLFAVEPEGGFEQTIGKFVVIR